MRITELVRYAGTIGVEQALVATRHCLRCVDWRGGVQVAPELELKGQFWCCPQCGTSYGEHPFPADWEAQAVVEGARP